MRALFMLLLLAPSVALASGTVTVRSDGTGDYTTISAAVAAAEADDCITTIDVGVGTWEEQVDLGALSVTLQGAGAEETIIDGGGLGPVVSIGPQAAGTGATVADLTVTNGVNGNGNGGCVAVSGASPTLRDVVVEGCQAPEGGCVALMQSDTTLQRVLVHDCQATSEDGAGGNGGGILIEGGDAAMHLVKVWDSAAPGIGGAVCFHGADGQLDSVWFRDGEADWGAALAVVEASSVTGDRVSLTDSTACNGGGGLSVYNNSTLVVTGLTVAENRFIAGGNGCLNPAGGGGLWAHTNANVTITGGQFTGNTSTAGGGAAWVSHDSGSRFEQVRVVGNSADGDGAGLMAAILDPIGDVDPQMDIISCHIAGNQADGHGGGAQLVVAEGVLRGNWFAENTSGDQGGGVAMEATTTGAELSHNLFVGNQAGRAAAVILRGVNIEATANTLFGGACTDQAAETGLMELRTQGVGASVELVSTVVGEATGCDYAVQATVPVAGGTGITASHALASPGSDGTLSPAMAAATSTASAPFYVDALDGPEFATTPPTTVESLQLVAQGGGRDGVDEGPSSLGNDPDGSAADLGAWGGEGAAVWTVDQDQDGATVFTGDCDDGDGELHPGATETCNCVDDDCDGLVDEDCDADGPCWEPGGGDDDDSADDDDAGDDDDSAAPWSPPPGCISECGVATGGAGAGWLVLLGILGLRRRRERQAA